MSMVMATATTRGAQPGGADDGGPPHDHGPGRARPGWRRSIWALVGWSLLILVVTVLRLRAGTPGHPLVIAVVGLTPFLAAPLVAAATSAWASGRRSLRAATALVTVAFFVSISPVDAVVGCGTESTADEITLYTANVLFFEGRPDDIAASIAIADPDIVVLQEMRGQFASELAADPRMAGYVHRSTDTSGAPESTAVWSRWPIARTEIERLGSVPVAHNLIESPHGSFEVTGIHLTAPAVPANVGPWLDELSAMATYETASPRILAGDFNATTDHRPFREVLDRGWTDVHEIKGCGFDATWPVGRGLPFPVLRLDHVLVTGHFDVLSVDFGDPGGSDHRPVITTVRLITDPTG